MAIETASYIAGLNSANPLSTDAVAQADDHIRLIKQVLLNTFPNLTGPVTATQDSMNVPFPVGGIVMWSGSVASVPTGWHLCDGTGGTPNLTDRFVVGAGSTYAVGATGGSNTVALTEAQLPSHTHAITAATTADGAHTHSITDPGHTHSYAAVTTPGGIAIGGGYGITATNTSSATTGVSINSGGAHTHPVTASATATGSGQAHENRPPYYALAYIMKL